jgi:hypothetical protein
MADHVKQEPQYVANSGYCSEVRHLKIDSAERRAWLPPTAMHRSIFGIAIAVSWADKTHI